jgi:hypothetical protein
VFVLDMIEILPPLEKYKYDTWRTLPVKCYIDNFMRLRSCIRNINTHHDLDVVDYKALTGLPLLWVPHFHARRGASLKELNSDTTSASKAKCFLVSR